MNKQYDEVKAFSAIKTLSTKTPPPQGSYEIERLLKECISYDKSFLKTFITKERELLLQLMSCQGVPHLARSPYNIILTRFFLQEDPTTFTQLIQIPSIKQFFITNAGNPDNCLYYDALNHDENGNNFTTICDDLELKRAFINSYNLGHSLLRVANQRPDKISFIILDSDIQAAIGNVEKTYPMVMRDILSCSKNKWEALYVFSKDLSYGTELKEYLLKCASDQNLTAEELNSLLKTCKSTHLNSQQLSFKTHDELESLDISSSLK